MLKPQLRYLGLERFKSISSTYPRTLLNHQLRASESSVQAIQASHIQVVQILTTSPLTTPPLAPSMDTVGGVTMHEMTPGGIRPSMSVQPSTSASINTIQSREFMRLMLIWLSPPGHWIQIWASGSTLQIATVSLWPIKMLSLDTKWIKTFEQ